MSPALPRPAARMDTRWQTSTWYLGMPNATPSPQGSTEAKRSRNHPIRDKLEPQSVADPILPPPKPPLRSDARTTYDSRTAAKPNRRREPGSLDGGSALPPTSAPAPSP